MVPLKQAKLLAFASFIRFLLNKEIPDHQVEAEQTQNILEGEERTNPR